MSPVKLSAATWVDRGERGAGGTSAIMAESCSVVMGKAGVVVRVGPSLGDLTDMDKQAGKADMRAYILASNDVIRGNTSLKSDKNETLARHVC